MDARTKKRQNSCDAEVSFEKKNPANIYFKQTDRSQ